jgi:tetratricopeptide (TPR) repeat protein
MTAKRTFFQIVLVLLLGGPALLWYLSTLHFKSGEEARQNNDCRRAVADYNHALTLFPFNVSIRERRAQCLHQLGLLRSALADYDRVLGRQPANADARFNRARTWFALGEYAQALQDCDAALEIAPDMAEALFLRGLIHFRQGRYENAVREFTQALASPPDDAAAAAYHTDRAQARWAAGDLAGAQDDFEAAIRLDPTHALAHAGLARLLADAHAPSVHDARRALELARKALDLDNLRPEAPLTPERPYLLDTLAAALAGNQFFGQAALAQLQALDMAEEENRPLTDVLHTTPFVSLAPEAMRKRLERYRQATP